jgi:hypothetical protein
LRRAADDEYLLPAGRSRKRNPTPGEFVSMERNGFLDDGRRFLWQRRNGGWWQTRLRPTEMRDEHGTHLWWYRCAERAGLVPLGITSGFPMQSARYSVGRRQFVQTGSLAELGRRLGGLGSGGTAGMIYRDNADLLNAAIRVVRRRMRLERRESTGAQSMDGTRVPMMWWKQPVAVFAQYVDDERELIELSRVSVEMLRGADASSGRLHEAAETLTRAVTATELIERAQMESANDHPLMHGHSLVAIWSAMETMVSDIVTAWLLAWPAARSQAASVVSTRDFNGLSSDEWASAVRDALDRKYRKENQKLKSIRRLDHFEWLLAAIGIGDDGQDRDVRMGDSLFEMQQIRNIFAHRRGRADARLVHRCPNLPFRAGQEIRIDRKAWSDFLVTTLVYGDMITRRMKRELGINDWMRSIPAPEVRYPAQLTGR